jgi:outer membrane murein-binding lipoprotein Lpp
MKRLLILGAVVALCGCAAQGRDEMMASKAALKACLAQHSQDVKACDSALMAFQADFAAYQPMMASAVSTPAQGVVQAPVSPQQSNFESFAAR